MAIFPEISPNILNWIHNKSKVSRSIFLFRQSAKSIRRRRQMLHCLGLPSSIKRKRLLTKMKATLLVLHIQNPGRKRLDLHLLPRSGLRINLSLSERQRILKQKIYLLKQQLNLNFLHMQKGMMKLFRKKDFVNDIFGFNKERLPYLLMLQP